MGSSSRTALQIAFAVAYIVVAACVAIFMHEMYIAAGIVVLGGILSVIVFLVLRKSSDAESKMETVKVFNEKSEEIPKDEAKKDTPTVEDKPKEDSKKDTSIVEDKPKEEPKSYIKPCPNPELYTKVDNNAQPKNDAAMNNDFLSKLVPSKDASTKAANFPYAKAEPVPVAPVSQPTQEPVAEELKEDPKEELIEPTKEESKEVSKEEPKEKPVSEEKPAKEVEEAPVVEESNGTQVDAESDNFTDYSPEALVRRAAWNKGLRCRRQYGDHVIQVAFVKPKVAVYVLDPSEKIADEDKIREEGWTILRFDQTKVTDGLAEGDLIAEAVKTNLHGQKASKKKSGKK